MKFLFFGTDAFSVAIVEKLISDFYYPEAIVTMPDKPVGRKQIMTPPAIKDVCIHHNIECLQPESLADIAKDLQSYDADYFIVASFGKIIPDEILNIPKQGCINVHTSLLPEYRGPSPIQAAIRDGKEETGISIMAMDAQMDHGGIYLQKKVAIEKQETYRSLHSKLAHVGADSLAKVLPDIVKGKLKAVEQDHDSATFTKIIKKEDAKIDWNKTAEEIDRFIRSCYDWPIAWTTLSDGKRLQIIAAAPLSIEEGMTQLTPGILQIAKKQVLVGSAKGNLLLERIQVEGKNEMNAEQFATGYQRMDGALLG